MFKPLAYRKTKIILVLVFLVCVVLFGFLQLVVSAVGQSYFPEIVLQRPIVKYDIYFSFFYLVSFLFGIIYSVFALLRQKYAFPMLVPILIALSASAFYSYAYQKGSGDALLFGMAGQNYKVSWDYNPYAETEKRGSYLRIEAFYPEFKPKFPFEKSNELAGYLVSATRHTTPELICLNWIPCSRVETVVSQDNPNVARIKSEVTKNLTAVQNASHLQIKVIKSAQKINEYTEVFFFQKNINFAFDKFGICRGNEYHGSCNYFFASGEFFYDVKIEAPKRKSIETIPFVQELPKIEAGVIKLFDSLIVK